MDVGPVQGLQSEGGTMANRSGGIRWIFRGLVIVSAVCLTASVGSADGTAEVGGPPQPVVIGGIRYEAEAGGRLGWVQAIDVKNERSLWSVRVFPAGSLADSLVDNPEVKVKVAVKSVRVLELFAVDGKLGVVGEPGRAAVVDLATHQVSPVRDARVAAVECPVHHEPTHPGLNPIHYGIATPLGFPRSDEFPFARRRIGAGCCVMPEREEIGIHCDSCLKAQQASLAKKAP